MSETEPQSQTFTAPLSSTSGRLVFRRGAANLILMSEPGLAELYKAEFSEPVPEIVVVGNNIDVTYRLNMSDWLKGWWFNKDRMAAKFMLNPTIGWQIEFKGGLSHLRADLTGMDIQAISVIGGASDVEFILPQVATVLPVTITGGASHVKLIHPAETGVKLHIVGGAAKVELGEQYLGAMGGEIILQTPGYKDSAGRIDLEVKGGVSDVKVQSAN
jgi:hypothetical protein